MTEDARWNRDTVPAGPGPASRSSRTTIPSPFDPPARDRFEEGEELGRGGMGRVFEARDVALGRAVAIKQSLTDDVAMLARFEREALITARLQHPGIVPVLDAGRDADGRPYYVMRKIEGRPLATVVAEARDAGARLALLPNMLAAVDAVAYAHARGVIHRDLKPWNILLGPFGETFVIDWGLARDGAGDVAGGATISGDDGLTRVGSAMGTPGFMAPEQARGDALDPRADVYALGATLVHLLAGKQPFAGIDPTVAIEAVARDELPHIEFPDEVPPELRTVAQKAMAAKAGDRYPDAGALASDLRRFLAGQLVAAHAYTTRERLARWLRKHRLAVAISTIAAIALVAVSTFAIRRVIVARDDARAARLRADDRADQTLVTHAGTFATTDPALAIAMLKQLPPTSRMWPRARVVIETAVTHGVGWGTQVRTGGAYTRIAASPSGDVVAMFGGDMIHLVDPGLRTPPRLLLERPDGLSQFYWFDDDSLVTVTDKGAVLRVRRDGTVTTLDVRGKSVALLMAHGEGRIFAKVDGNVRELDPDGGPPRAELGPMKHVERVAGALLYQRDAATPLVIAEDGAPEQTVPGVDLGGRIIVPHFGENRLATYTDREIIEYARAGGVWTERGRWTIDPAHVVYRNQTLMAIDGAGVAYLWPGRPPAREPAAIMREGTVVPNAVISSDDGVFVIGDTAIHALKGGVTQIAGYADRPTSFAKAGSYLVTISRTGLLRSWDLRTFYPHTFTLENARRVVEVEPHRAWFQNFDQALAYDLATRKLEPMIGAYKKFDSSTVACDGPDFTILKLDEQRRVVMGESALVATRTRDGTITPIAGVYDHASCPPGQRWLALKRASQIEVRDGRAPQQAGRVFEAPGVIHSYVLNEHWLAIMDKTGGITRVELATGRVLPAFDVGKVNEYNIDVRGRVATSMNGAIQIWTDGKPRTVIDKLEVTRLLTHPYGFLVFARDGTVVVIDQEDRIARYDIGERALSIAMDAHRIGIIIDGKVGVLDIRDGSVVRLPWRAASVALSRDGTWVAWVTQSGLAGILRVELPEEPGALLRHLGEISNATLAPGSTEITWQ